MALRSDLHGQELVAVKDGRSTETLRREAAILGDLDHPGVIRFVALTEDERGPRLLTRYAGRETLATWQPQRVEELRRVVEDLAAAVGHLHEHGVVHRSIRPNHVVIDAMRRPLLCGFSSARRFADPTRAVTGGPGLPGGAAGADSAGEPGSDSGGDTAGALGGEPGGDTASTQGGDTAGTQGGDSGGDTAPLDPEGEQLADVVAIGETVVATLQRLAAHRTRPNRRREEQRLRERLGGVAQAAAAGRVPTAKALSGQIRALGTEPATLRRPGSGETAGRPPDEPEAGAPATAGDDTAPGGVSAPGDAAAGLRGALPGGASGVHGALPRGAGAAGSASGPHADPPPAEALQRLREPAGGTQRRQRPTVARPSGPRRHPGRAPRRLPHVRQRPRRATVLAVAAVCGGCVLGTLMVMRLVGADAPAPVRPVPVGGPATGAGETPTGIPGQGDASPALDLALHPPGRQAAAAPAPPAAAPGLPAPPDGNPAAAPGVAAPADPYPAAGGPDPVPPPGGADADLAAVPPTPATGDATLCRPIADGFRDVNGDGCAEEIGLTAGFVWVDGIRYPVGDAGDQVAVGDWDCDGLATVALVQPGGRVYLFDSWPRQAPLVGSLVAELAPPVQLADVPRGACNELRVRYAGGTWFLPVPAPSH